MRRRDAVAKLAGIAVAPMLLALRTRATVPDFPAIERSTAGRLGVAVLDTQTSRRLAYRADERFPMCSTFKWLLAAQILSRVEAGEERLSRFVPFGASDLLAYAPVTRAHLTEGGMSVADLAAAAVQVSDNTAGNLLLRAVGGPAALTAFLRGIGDDTSRLDRMEPELNEARPGDVRDTTTPSAMLADMQRLLLGDRLAAPSREQLVAWLAGSTTGASRVRAGVPHDWRVGDKTGSGGHGATNDVAILWPPGRKPVLIAAYLAKTDAPPAVRDNALAEVGRAVAAWV